MTAETLNHQCPTCGQPKPAEMVKAEQERLDKEVSANREAKEWEPCCREFGLARHGRPYPGPGDIWFDQGSWMFVTDQESGNHCDWYGTGARWDQVEIGQCPYCWAALPVIGEKPYGLTSWPRHVDSPSITDTIKRLRAKTATKVAGA